MEDRKYILKNIWFVAKSLALFSVSAVFLYWDHAVTFTTTVVVNL